MLKILWNLSYYWCKKPRRKGNVYGNTENGWGKNEN